MTSSYVPASASIPVDVDVLFDGFSRLARADGADALSIYQSLMDKRAIPKAKRNDFTDFDGEAAYLRKWIVDRWAYLAGKLDEATH